MAFEGVSPPLLGAISIGSSYLTLVDSPGDYTPFGSLYQYDAPAFGAFETVDVAGGQYPHFKAVIYNDLEADNETCFRGELLIILRLMLGQLRKIRLLHHNIAPVILHDPLSLFYYMFVCC